MGGIALSGRRKKYFWLALSILWMLVIFMTSSQPHSRQDVKPFLSNLLDKKSLDSVLPAVNFKYAGYYVSTGRPYDFLEFLIRKSVHVGIYALLAVFYLLTLVSWGKSTPVSCLLSLLLGLVYAAMDELHQFYVPGRTGAAADVGVDFAGVLAGVVAWLLLNSRKGA